MNWSVPTGLDSHTLISQVGQPLEVCVWGGVGRGSPSLIRASVCRADTRAPFWRRPGPPVVSAALINHSGQASFEAW